MTGERGSGTIKRYRACARSLRAEGRPGRLTGRGAVAADRAITTRPARVDVGDALPLFVLPHAGDRGAELVSDRVEVVVAGLPRLGILVDLGLQVLVPQLQAQTLALRV